MKGFYRSSYLEQNQTKWLAVTQFEPTFARMAFPCYDEPRFKTPFTINFVLLERNYNYTILSNMPCHIIYNSKSLMKWYRCEETKPMPTYLVAFAFVQFANLKTNSNRTSTWMRPDAIEDGAYMQEIGEKLLSLMENYTGIKYLLPKLDFLAVPDFDMGAMENWGLITFREQAMLYNKEVCSERAKEKVTLIAAHEISHQWFGDYVTPVWWDYLWLNEGFARYFQYKITADLQPTWRMEEYFVVTVMQPMLFDDEVSHSHGLTTKVNTPNEIYNHFDTVTYAKEVDINLKNFIKGASILRMIEHILQTEPFRKALRKYLTTGYKQGGSVNPTDLWNAFDDQVKEDNITLPMSVSDIMNEWTNRAGYPLIQVSRVPHKHCIPIQQHVYHSWRSSVNKSESPAKWVIPLTFTKKSHINFHNTTPSLWLEAGKKIVLHGEIDPDTEWILFNVQSAGYYRINYYNENWELLIHQLLTKPEEIHVLNKAQLIDDSISLAIDNHLPYEIPISLLKYLDKEHDIIPWFPALTKFDYLYSQYKSTRIGPLLREYMIDRIQHQYKRLRFHVNETDDHLTKIGREWIVDVACTVLQYPECIRDAEEEYSRNEHSLNKVQPDVKLAVFCVALYNQTHVHHVWNNLWKLYKTSNVAFEKDIVLLSLGCAKNEELLKQFIYKTIKENDTDIREQDHITVYRSIGDNAEGVKAALLLVKELISVNKTGISLSTRSMKKLVQLLQFVSNKITNEKQIELLSELIKIENGKNEEYKGLKEAITSAYEFGQKSMKNRRTSMDRIEIAIQSSIESSVSPFIPSMLTYYRATYLTSNYHEYFHSATDKNYNSTKNIYKLPQTTKPLSYNLTICPELSGNFNFSGTVEIEILVEDTTSDIYLHSSGLDIKGVNVKKKNRNIEANFIIEKESELLNIKTSPPMVKSNTYVVKIKYEGTLNDNMVGFYRSSYKTGNQINWLATTQFEPVYARRAFPCYDEPSYKTKFNISVGRYQNMKTLSNTPLKYTTNPDPSDKYRVYDVFEETPAMPTYLVAFMVFNFSYISTADRSFSVWTRPDAIDYAKLSFDFGKKALKQLEMFTNITYLLKKMDMVAIPDFNAGAMENWGLTTYRERYLLYDPKVCSTRIKEISMNVITHELSHQWFGNLVTANWWDYIWLNEGFATYFEYHITHEVDSTLRMNDYFVLDVCHDAMIYDGIHTFHGMTSTVNTPEEINGKFDIISYDKGACVIRMLNHMVTSPIFKNALHYYLKEGYKSGGSVTPSNLWDAFDDIVFQKNITLARDSSIGSIMKQWTEKPGYPLITVERRSNGKHVHVVVTQTQYKVETLNSSKNTTENITGGQEWIVPFTYTTKSAVNFNNTKPTVWLYPKNSTVLPDTLTDDEWIICNIQQTGYYRVNYDLTNWKLLTDQLKKSHEVIHPLNRAQLINDCFVFAMDKKLPFAVFFNLVEYLSKEEDILPYTCFLRNIHNLLSKLNTTPTVTSVVKNFVSRIIRNIYKKIGFTEKPEDDHLTKSFRSLLLRLACEVNHSDCANVSRSLYSKGSNNVAPDLRDAVFCTMLKSNKNKTVFGDLWNLYKKSDFAFEKENILLLLGCVNDQELLKSFFYKLIDKNDTDIRLQNHVYIKRAIFSSDDGVSAALKFVEEAIPKLNTLDENHRALVMNILSRLNLMVKSDEHEKLLQKIEQKLNKFDSKNYTSIIIAIQTLQNSLSRTKALIEDRSKEIAFALRGFSEETTTKAPQETTTTKPGPSSGNSNSTNIRSVLKMDSEDEIIVLASTIIINSYLLRKKKIKKLKKREGGGWFQFSKAGTDTMAQLYCNISEKNRPANLGTFAECPPTILSSCSKKMVLE
ncbi:hypothetical protein PGB90_010127 [Kerria lacca]